MQLFARTNAHAPASNLPLYDGVGGANRNAGETAD